MSDKSDFCWTKVTFVGQNLLLSTKVWMLQTGPHIWQVAVRVGGYKVLPSSTRYHQRLALQAYIDKITFVVDKITFVRQK